MKISSHLIETNEYKYGGSGIDIPLNYLHNLRVRWFHDPDERYIAKALIGKQYGADNFESGKPVIFAFYGAIGTYLLLSSVVYFSFGINIFSIIGFSPIVLFLLYYIIFSRKYRDKERKENVSNYLNKFWKKYVGKLSQEEKNYLKKYFVPGEKQDEVGYPRSYRYFDQYKYIEINKDTPLDSLLRKKIIRRNTIMKQNTNYFISQWANDFLKINTNIFR